MFADDFSRSTNEEIAENIRQRIDARTWGRIWWLRVELRGDQVVIHGTSPSYYVIQLALVVVRDIFPVRPVELDIQVVVSRPRAPEGRDSDAETLPWRHDQGSAQAAPPSEPAIGRPSAGFSPATRRLLALTCREPHISPSLLN